MTYNLQYMAAWAVAAIGVVAGVLAGASQTPWHPAWLSGDMAATAGLVSAICVSLAALLPQIHRTPSTREAAYLSAAVGVLPPDLASRHPEVLTPPMTPGEPQQK